MFTNLRRVYRENRAWGMICGAIVVGSVVKVVYFGVSRQAFVRDAQEVDRKGWARLKEAHEYSEWSRQDLEKRLPPLTPEQEEQMRQYLQLVEYHGVTKMMELQNKSQDCSGGKCPVLKAQKKFFENLSSKSESSAE